MQASLAELRLGDGKPVAPQVARIDPIAVFREEGLAKTMSKASAQEERAMAGVPSFDRKTLPASSDCLLLDDKQSGTSAALEIWRRSFPTTGRA